jgi:hypothetical protein
MYLFIENEQRGPFSREQIKMMYSAGTINSETLYWEDGQSDWRPIDELFASSTPDVEVPTKSTTVPISVDENQTAKSIRQNKDISIARQPTVATYNETSDTFSGSILLVVKLAVRAIQSLNWKVEYVNENIGSVSFEAGSGAVTAYDYSCSLSVEEVGLNTYRVTSTGKLKPRGNTVFALDGGSGKKAAQKAVDRMKAMALSPNKEFHASRKVPIGCIVILIFVIVLVLLVAIGGNH